MTEKNPIEWISFYDSFNEAINKNTLSNVEKLSYFLNFVTEIKDLQLSNSTYQTALDLLNERYNIPQITISLLMSNLWNLETW